jgi:molecular chaperone GrpE
MFACRQFCDAKTDKKPEEAEQAAADAENKEGATAADAGNSGEEEVEEPGRDLEEEVATLQAQVKAAQDQHLRNLAEMENVRTIAKRDVETAKQFAVQKFAKSLLEVADNLARATETVGEGEQSPEVANLVQGVTLTQNQLLKVFAGNGIEQVGVISEMFDPNFHEAMFEYDDPDQEPGAIGQIVSIGYKMKGRCLRAAQVGIIKNRE